MQHLDEGTIHAWLDGQLPGEEAAAVEAHVAECRQCADAVAEARGLIAASSRILTALDSVPRSVAPATPLSQPSAAPRLPSAISHQPSATLRARRRWFNGPSLAAAATIVVAVGTFALMRAGVDKAPLAARDQQELASARRASGPSEAPSPASVSSSAAPVPAASPAPSVAANEVAPVDGRRRFVDSAGPVAVVAAPSRDERPTAVAGQQGARSQPASNAAAVVGRAASTPTAEATELRKTVAPSQQPVPGSQREEVAQARARPAAPAPAPADSPPARLVERASALRPSTDSARVELSRKDALVGTGTVRGRVTDANNTGLDGVSVTIANTSIGTTTSPSGEFMLLGVPAGPQRIVARRLGFTPVTQPVTVNAAQDATATITLAPAATSLEQVVTTGTGAQVARQKAAAPAPPSAAAEPTAATAHGCYDLGITPGFASTPTRTGFRHLPRRISLDSAVVSGRSDGVWYVVRDLTRPGTPTHGVWRPATPDAIEVQWETGTRLATMRLTGVGGAILRGTVDEIDRTAGSAESGVVVAGKSACSRR